jgi:hypothetical protein
VQEAIFPILYEQYPKRVLLFAKKNSKFVVPWVLCPRHDVLDESVFAFILEWKI